MSDLPAFDFTASVATLNRAGYRVIPKNNIIRIGAYTNVTSEYEKHAPAVVADYVAQTLGQQIGYQLTPFLKIERKEDIVIPAIMYSAVIEVIKI